MRLQRRTLSCASLRLGYVVGPKQLSDSVTKIRSTMDQHSSAIDQATLARFINEDFSSAISNACETFMPTDESSSSKNSIDCSAIDSSFKFQKQDSTSSRGFDARQILRESRASALKSESNPHRSHSIASRRSLSQLLYSVLLPGRPHKFYAAL